MLKLNYFLAAAAIALVATPVFARNWVPTGTCKVFAEGEVQSFLTEPLKPFAEADTGTTFEWCQYTAPRGLSVWVDTWNSRFIDELGIGDSTNLAVLRTSFFLVNRGKDPQFINAGETYWLPNPEQDVLPVAANYGEEAQRRAIARANAEPLTRGEGIALFGQLVQSDEFQGGISEAMQAAFTEALDGHTFTPAQIRDAVLAVILDPSVDLPDRTQVAADVGGRLAAIEGRLTMLEERLSPAELAGELDASLEAVKVLPPYLKALVRKEFSAIIAERGVITVQDVPAVVGQAAQNAGVSPQFVTDAVAAAEARLNARLDTQAAQLEGLAAAMVEGDAQLSADLDTLRSETEAALDGKLDVADHFQALDEIGALDDQGNPIRLASEADTADGFDTQAAQIEGLAAAMVEGDTLLHEGITENRIGIVWVAALGLGALIVAIFGTVVALAANRRSKQTAKVVGSEARVGRRKYWLFGERQHVEATGLVGEMAEVREELEGLGHVVRLVVSDVDGLNRLPENAVMAAWPEGYTFPVRLRGEDGRDYHVSFIRRSRPGSDRAYVEAHGFSDQNPSDPIRADKNVLMGRCAKAMRLPGGLNAPNGVRGGSAQFAPPVAPSAPAAGGTFTPPPTPPNAASQLG